MVAGKESVPIVITPEPIARAYMSSSVRLLTALIRQPPIPNLRTHSPRVQVRTLARRRSAFSPDPGQSCPTKLNHANKIPSQAQKRSQQISAQFSSSSSAANASSSSNPDMATPQASLPNRGGFDSKAPEKYTARKNGAPYTFEHRVYLEKDGIPLSPLHDIPLFANEQQTILNMVVEVPRWTNAKQEVRLQLPMV